MNLSSLFFLTWKVNCVRKLSTHLSSRISFSAAIRTASSLFRFGFQPLDSCNVQLHLLEQSGNGDESGRVEKSWISSQGILPPSMIVLRVESALWASRFGIGRTLRSMKRVRLVNERTPPPSIDFVPLNCPLKTFLEPHFRLPAEPMDLPAIEGVPEIVA